MQKLSEAGEITFDTPVAMPGAVSLALDPNGEPESFYADGIDRFYDLLQLRLFQIRVKL